MEEHIGEVVMKIQERKARVEVDKAWEVSLTRRSTIALVTYICAAVLLYVIGVENYLLSALVPVLGYLLSTQSLPFVKKWWTEKMHTKK